ncbi:MAG: cyanophycin synthetase, partial [Thermomicrobiales bacterium]
MIENRNHTIYRGPNIWARLPVIRVTTDIGELENRPTNKIPGFYEALTELVPSLYEHVCSVGKPGGFLQRMREGTWMGHVLEHLALELQNLAGAEVSRGKTRGTGERGVYNVVFAYEQEDVGLAALDVATRTLNHLIYASEPGFDFQRALEDDVIRVAERLAYGPSTGAIVSEAMRREIPVIRLDPRRSLVQLGHGKYQKRIWATVTSETSNIAVDTAANKELTNRLLHEVGIPVPRAKTVRNVDEAATEARRIGFPVVIKPLDGNHGRGVCINLKDADEVREFYDVAESESRAGIVVVESFIPGKDYRILVVNNVVVAVAERVPAHVVGDGEHDIQTLIDLTNLDPRRGVGHEKVLTRISIDEQTRETLERQDLALTHVPAKDQIVWLKRTGNMSTGGTSIDRTDDIHPDNEEIARQAAMVVGLDIAGIDFIVPDISRSIRQIGGAIVEVNAGPGFRMHTHPTDGHPRHVGRAVIDMLFPKGSPSRIPIVAVTGTNGKTTTSRMIAHIMKTAGHRVGMTTTDGIYVDGIQIMAGDMSGPTSAKMVLKNPAINYAVLETARGGILRSGLGFDRCDIAVVTNVAGDHLGQHGIDSLSELARVKAVVPQSVFRDGKSVLNADDEHVVEMARHARGEILYFSVDEENPVIREHLRARGRAVVLRRINAGEMITIIEHRRETSLLLASQIPATFEGRLRVNILNALAAATAALADDVQLEHIRTALKTFSTSYFQTPGRFNQLDHNGRRYVMDYCHNLAGLQAMADFVSRMESKRTLGMISIPGDRLDTDIAAFGALAGRVFDELIVREDTNTRGRDRGDIATRLKAAATSAGLDEQLIHIVLEEKEAVEEAFQRSQSGDL